MKGTCRLTVIIALLLLPLALWAKHRVWSPQVKTLQVVVNQNWTRLPVMTLGSDDVLHVDFDELSHTYHRYLIHLDHCEPDWLPTEGLFESDWLEGFNDLPIEDYENSVNTTVLYTHYHFSIPNDRCRLKLSGNYRIHVLDEDNDREEVLTAEFRVVEPIMNIGLGVTTNTDIDFNEKCQQVVMTVNYNSIRVSNPQEQIQTLVMQNGREDTQRLNIRPTSITPKGLQWEHSRQLIFDAGNEFHKFEVLDTSHPTMGLDHITWDENEERYHAFPFFCEQRRNYVYDEDANGAFYIRNSDNVENDYSSDYVYVHYKLMAQRQYDYARIVIDGQWTTEEPDSYVMHYDENNVSYNAVVLQKQGYYNYQLLMRDADGQTHPVPEEGSFYQTENRYDAMVYYKGTGERTWRLVGFQEKIAKF